MDQTDQIEMKTLEKILEKYKVYQDKQMKYQKVDQNEKFVILLGTTGIGKSTIFNLLVGASFRNQSKGEEENKNSGYVWFFYNHEQQWLDSMKYYRILKHCKNAVFLLIMRKEQILDRTQSIDLDELFSQLKGLSGIQSTMTLSKMIRIVLNKSNKQGNEIKGLQSIIEKNIKKSTNQQDKEYLAQLLQILKQRFIHIKKPTYKTDDVLSENKKNEIIKLISLMESRKISPFLTFLNYKLLNYKLQIIRQNYYNVEHGKFVAVFKQAINDILQFLEKTEFPEETILIFLKYILQKSLKKQDTLSLQSFEFLQKNQQYYTIFVIINQIVKIQQTIQSWQKKNLKKLPNQFQELMELFSQYNPQFQLNLDNFKRQYRILLKFSTPEQSINDDGLLMYKREQLKLSQIDNLIFINLKKLIIYRDKFKNRAQELEIQYLLESNDLGSEYTALYIKLQLLIEANTKYYTEFLDQFRSHKIIIQRWCNLWSNDPKQKKKKQIKDEVENYGKLKNKQQNLWESLFEQQNSFDNPNNFQGCIDEKLKKLKDAEQKLEDMLREHKKYQIDQEQLICIQQKLQSSQQTLQVILQQMKGMKLDDSYIIKTLKSLFNDCFLGNWTKFLEFFGYSGNSAAQYYGMEQINQAQKQKSLRIQNNKKQKIQISDLINLLDNYFEDWRKQNLKKQQRQEKEQKDDSDDQNDKNDRKLDLDKCKMQ